MDDGHALVDCLVYHHAAGLSQGGGMGGKHCPMGFGYSRPGSWRHVCELGWAGAGTGYYPVADTGEANVNYVQRDTRMFHVEHPETHCSRYCQHWNYPDDGNHIHRCTRFNVPLDYDSELCAEYRTRGCIEMKFDAAVPVLGVTTVNEV